MRRLLIAAVALLTVSPIALACGETKSSSTNCPKVTEKDVSALFDRWNASLATGDPDEVVANYAEAGVLLPTISDVPRTTPAEMRAYFVDFLKKKPQGSIKSSTIHLGCGVASDTGTYTFTFSDGSSAEARYTYVYDYEDGAWRIVSHHSSLDPAKG